MEIKENRVRIRIAVLLPVFLSGVLLTGCAATGSVQNIEQLEFGHEPARILLMPLDVELSRVTAGGIVEPKADWTANAKKHMLAAFEYEAGKRDAGLVLYDADRVQTGSVQLQLERLHRAVGSMVLLHQYQRPLPSKKKALSWTLGDRANQLKKDYSAQYALFVFVRDSYSSKGRQAYQLLSAIATMGGFIRFGAVTGGSQVGFASLVDLNNGDIVWFNRLSQSWGELRTQEAAAVVISRLLSTLPGR